MGGVSSASGGVNGVTMSISLTAQGPKAAATETPRWMVKYCPVGEKGHNYILIIIVEAFLSFFLLMLPEFLGTMFKCHPHLRREF